ncbi:MAG: hypothetical protein EPO22_01400 [Dehalococcoidia bacterium]|nr:MAG: hypothetical protein EPO22_01400 [Dehalococcoidia bacterium]
MNPVTLLLWLLAIGAAIAPLAACSSGGGSRTASSPVRTPPQRPEDVYSYCFDDARAAGDNVAKNGWGPTQEYTAFTSQLDGFAGSLLPETDNSIADWFQAPYQQLTGKSPWVDPKARDAFDAAFAACNTKYGGSATPASEALRPAPDIQQKTVCVAGAAYHAEATFGPGSLEYSADYNTWVHDNIDEDESTDYHYIENEYTQATGKSPFTQPDAAGAFRTATAGC